MLIVVLMTLGLAAILAAFFTAADKLLARRERCEKERWNKAFGGTASGARSGSRRDA